MGGGGGNYGSGGYGPPPGGSSNIDWASAFAPGSDFLSRLGIASQQGNTAAFGSPTPYSGTTYPAQSANSGSPFGFASNATDPRWLFPMQNPNVGQPSNFTPKGTGPGFWQGLGPGGPNTDWYGDPEYDLSTLNSQSAFFHPPYQPGGGGYRML